MKALVLFSGGLDSSVCLGLAVRQYGAGEVLALSIYYGQKHKKEMEASQKVAEYYGVKRVTLDLGEIYRGSDCTLLEGAKEEILLVCAGAHLEGRVMLFVTRSGLIKKVPCTEFVTNNRTVASTKLADGDRLAAVTLISDPETDVVLLTDQDFTLRFPLAEVSEMKKAGRGEKGIKLGKNDEVIAAYLISDVRTVEIRGREVNLARLKQGHRYTKGSKTRA